MGIAFYLLFVCLLNPQDKFVLLFATETSNPCLCGLATRRNFRSDVARHKRIRFSFLLWHNPNAAPQITCHPLVQSKVLLSSWFNAVIFIRMQIYLSINLYVTNLHIPLPVLCFST
jgi:hypothetical protein